MFKINAALCHLGESYYEHLEQFGNRKLGLHCSNGVMLW